MSVRSSERDRITVKIHNMKRTASRSPVRKRRATSRSSSPESRGRRRRSPSYGSPPHHYAPSRSHREPPPPAESRSYSYKVLCVSAIHAKASDEFIKESLFREYKHFGEFSIRISHDLDERVAYICFRSAEDARKAKHAKPRVVLYDKVALVEPVYESRRSSRPRSSSPPPEYDRHYYNRSPEKRRPPPDHHYDPHYSHPPSHPPHHDPYRPPIRHEYIPRGGPYGRPYMPRPPRHSYAPRPYIPRPRIPIEKPEKKENLPHYLQHVPPEDDPLATRTLFAGNLEINISDDELKRIFGKYGILEDIDIKRPPPGTGNAFAFVKYQTLDQAVRAKVDLSGQYIGKFQCKIGYGKATPTTKVWIGGLGAWTSVTQLEREFDRFGAIKKIEYVKGDTHAYILYDSIDAATAAVKEMRGFPLGGPEHRLRLDYADDGLPPPAFKQTKPAGFEETGEYRKPPEYDYPEGESGAPAPHHPEPTYHPPPHYATNHFIPRYRGRGGYRGRGSYRGAHYNPHYDPHYRFPGAHHEESSYRPRGPPPHHAAHHQDDYHPHAGGGHPPRRSRTPVDRSRSRSPHESNSRRRSPDYDSDSSARRAGALSQARTLPEIARKSSTVWQGALILKSSLFPAKLHLTDGADEFVETLMKDEKGKNHLRITQRLRLDQPKLDDVQKRITSSSSHAIFLGMPSSTASITSDDSSVQTRPLRNLVSYLKQKEAAGVISLLNKEEEINGVLYAFPPCDFSTELLKRTCHSVTDESLKEDYLVIVVVRGGAA